MNVDTNTDRDTDIIGDRDIVTGKQDTGLAASQANEEGKKRQHDLSTWEVTRIGPMLTTGGYDWVQIGWYEKQKSRNITIHLLLYNTTIAS